MRMWQRGRREGGREGGRQQGGREREGQTASALLSEPYLMVERLRR